MALANLQCFEVCKLCCVVHVHVSYECCLERKPRLACSTCSGLEIFINREDTEGAKHTEGAEGTEVKSP